MRFMTSINVHSRELRWGTDTYLLPLLSLASAAISIGWKRYRKEHSSFTGSLAGAVLATICGFVMVLYSNYSAIGVLPLFGFRPSSRWPWLLPGLVPWIAVLAWRLTALRRT